MSWLVEKGINVWGRNAPRRKDKDMDDRNRLLKWLQEHKDIGQPFNIEDHRTNGQIYCIHHFDYIVESGMLYIKIQDSTEEIEPINLELLNDPDKKLVEKVMSNISNELYDTVVKTLVDLRYYWQNMQWQETLFLWNVTGKQIKLSYNHLTALKNTDMPIHEYLQQLKMREKNRTEKLFHFIKEHRDIPLLFGKNYLSGIYLNGLQYDDCCEDTSVIELYGSDDGWQALVDSGIPDEIDRECTIHIDDDWKSKQENTLDIDYAFEYTITETKHNGIKIDCLYLYNMNSTQYRWSKNYLLGTGMI